MNQTHHEKCFGTMFPDVLHVENDRTQRGKGFSVLLERAGGMFRCNREVTGDCTAPLRLDQRKRFVMAQPSGIRPPRGTLMDLAH